MLYYPPTMNRQTEEHKQHLSESLRRFWSTLSPEERERRRAECVRCGLKSVAMRTPEEMAAQIARLQRPEVRARNAEAVAKRKAQLTAEDPDWMKKILREKWSRHDPATEAQRKTRAENARRMRAQMTPEQTAALREASRKALRKPIEGHPDSTSGEVVRFNSAGDAA